MYRNKHTSSPLTIVNYSPKWAKDIDHMESNEWGDWGTESIDDMIDEKEIIRVALLDNTFVGVTYGRLIDDQTFWLDVICILPAFQKRGFGTRMLQDMTHYVKEKYHVKRITTEAVLWKGKSNSKKLFENFGFSFIKAEDGFWEKEYPDTFCKNCHHNPCKCTTLFYQLNLE